MSDIRISAAPYELALLRPLHGARGTMFHRAGTLVTAVDEDGVTGYGEAAPLDADEHERAHTTLEAVASMTTAGWRLACGGIEQAASVNAQSSSHAEGEQTSQPSAGPTRCALAIGYAVSELLAPSASPAARSALECALLDLAARRSQTSISKLLGGPASTSLEVNALVSDEDEREVARHVERLAAQGFRTIKLKLGSAGAASDLVRIRAACAHAPTDAILRLDANRAWTLDQSLEVLGSLAGLPVDYVEDPLADAASLPALREGLTGHARIGIAADETVTTVADVHAAASGCDVVVLKLQRVGGPLAAVRLAHAARERGMRVVFTDSLESAVGRAATLQCAAACTTEAVGLAGAFHLPDGASHARPRLDVGSGSTGHAATSVHART